MIFDGFVKSPSAALHCILRRCGVLPSTPPQVLRAGSRETRESFLLCQILTFYEFIKFADLVKSRNSPPLVGGDNGEGENNTLEFLGLSPSPRSLPSREREYFCLFTRSLRLKNLQTPGRYPNLFIRYQHASVKPVIYSET